MPGWGSPSSEASGPWLAWHRFPNPQRPGSPADLEVGDTSGLETHCFAAALAQRENAELILCTDTRVGIAARAPGVPANSRELCHLGTLVAPTWLRFSRPGGGWWRSREPESYLWGGYPECPARVPGDSPDCPRRPPSIWLVYGRLPERHQRAGKWVRPRFGLRWVLR